MTNYCYKSVHDQWLCCYILNVNCSINEILGTFWIYNIVLVASIEYIGYFVYVAFTKG